jgi:uncharacterized protein DUF4865
MLAMQYSARLPEQFSSQSVRERVSARSPLFNALPGLSHKFYLYDDEEHYYAPLYIWHDHHAAQQFLMEDLFSGFVDTFGRPRVRTWNILNFDYGERGVSPTYVCYSVDKVNVSSDLQDFVKTESVRHQQTIAVPNLFANLVLLDADRWELSRFSFWSSKADSVSYESDCSYDFEVINALPVGTPAS